jgi:PAS domain S-box-containing protein
MNVSDELFRLLVESVQDYAIYLLDPAGFIRSWNTGAQRLKGYDRSEIIGQHFSIFFTPAERTGGKPSQLLAAAREAGRNEDSGWRLRKDGSQFWANAIITALHDEHGTLVGFAKVTRDLTDRGYRQFVEATHSIVWTTDASGIPNADSPTWREHTGQSEDEWRSGRGWDPLHPDDVETMRVAWTTAKQSGAPLNAEFRLRNRAGEYVWMGARAIPFRSIDGRIREWFGVSFDISDRKRAEEERERARDLLTTTLRSIGDAVIATDTAGRVTFMNTVAEQLTGWSTDEASGKPLIEVFPIFNEDTGTGVENPVERVLREGVTVGLANHTVLRRRDGTEIPIDDSAAPIRSHTGHLEGVVLVFRDVSEEKRALYRRLFLARATEEIAAASDYQDALRRIAQLACPRMADWTGISVIDPATGGLEQLAVAHVDPAKVEFATALGKRYPADPDAPTGAPNVIRTGKTELYPEISPAMLEAGAVDAEHLRLLQELDLRSAMIVPLRGQRDVFGAMTFIFSGTGRRYTHEDVELAEELSTRVSVMIERQRLQEEAVAANRMKDEFLATISHELRTPLQAILGYASMLERNTLQDPGKAIAVIIRNAQAQARLIDDMLDMSRILSGKLRLEMARVDLGAAIDAAVDAVRPSATARGITVRVDVASDIGYVTGDFDRLQQIVWNLVSNAVKFTPRDGALTVTAAREGSHVTLRVSDTGRGIPREHLRMVFERFRQLDNSSTRNQSGLGLGLAIVRYLVEAHGGTVTADSAGLNQGSTFTVTLPMQTEALAGGPLSHAATGRMLSQALHGVHALLVDDDDDTRSVLADALASVGAQVRQASSAKEALALLERETPHVILSDIGMPHEDGYELIRRIRALPTERGGTVPAIAVTAYARHQDVERAIRSGFQLQVTKPVALDSLIEAIKACVRA